MDLKSFVQGERERRRQASRDARLAHARRYGANNRAEQVARGRRSAKAAPIVIIPKSHQPIADR